MLIGLCLVKASPYTNQNGIVHCCVIPVPAWHYAIVDESILITYYMDLASTTSCQIVCTWLVSKFKNQNVAESIDRIKVSEFEVTFFMDIKIRTF